jgi:hypothetical protein
VDTAIRVAALTRKHTWGRPVPTAVQAHAVSSPSVSREIIGSVRIAKRPLIDVSHETAFDSGVIPLKRYVRRGLKSLVFFWDASSIRNSVIATIASSAVYVIALHDGGVNGSKDLDVLSRVCVTLSARVTEHNIFFQKSSIESDSAYWRV